MSLYTQYVEDEISVVRHTSSKRIYVSASAGDEVFAYIGLDQVSDRLSAQLHKYYGSTEGIILGPEHVRYTGETRILHRLASVPWEDFLSEYERVEAYSETADYPDLERGVVCFSTDDPLTVTYSQDIFFVAQYKDKNMSSHIYGSVTNPLYEYAEFELPGLFDLLKTKLGEMKLAMDLADQSLQVSFAHGGKSITLKGFRATTGTSVSLPSLTKSQGICLRWLGDAEKYDYKTGYRLVIKDVKK